MGACMADTVIQMSPLGWWLNYKADQWCGPYETPEKAIEAADIIVPLSYSTYKLMRVMPWETREIRTNQPSEPCPNCKGTGFVHDSCCRVCEGSMSIKRRIK